MKCSKCGSEIPSQSKFCLSCGQAVGATGEMQSAPAPAGSRKPITAMAIIAGVILVAAIGFAYWRSNILKAPRPGGNQTPVVKAPTSAGGPQADVLKTNVKNQPVDLNAPKKNPPPQEVVAYLDHLQKVEVARQDLQRREAAAMLTLMTKAQAANLEQWLKASDPDMKVDEAASTAEAKKLTGEMNTEWQKLCEFFLSVQAPEPCAALSGQYYDALRGVIGAFQQVNDKVANLDVGALYLMQGQTAKLDEKFTKTDTELSNVCTRFGIDKTFSVTSDGGMPNLVGAPNTQAPMMPAVPAIPTKP